MPASNKVLAYRKKIDKIDDQILKLLNSRADLSLSIRKLKTEDGSALFDAKREEEIIQTLTDKNKGPLYNEDISKIFSSIMKMMRELPDAK